MHLSAFPVFPLVIACCTLLPRGIESKTFGACELASYPAGQSGITRSVASNESNRNTNKRSPKNKNVDSPSIATILSSSFAPVIHHYSLFVCGRQKRSAMHHHHKLSIFLTSLLIPLLTCDSSEPATDKSVDPSDPQFVDKKLDEINKKTDQVKGFINDIPKFLDSIHAIQKAEKELADKIASDEAKVKVAQGRSKRSVEPQAGMPAGERYKPDSNNVINSNLVMTKDELVDHSIDYINNTLPEVKTKLVQILESYLKTNATTQHSTVYPYENDSDFVFPSIVPQSTLSATLHRYDADGDGETDPCDADNDNVEQPIY